MVTSPKGQTIPTAADAKPLPGKSVSDVGDRWRAFWVFLQWGIRRESLSLWNYTILLLPVLVSAFFFRNLVLGRYSSQGSTVLESLLGVATFFIFIGGVRHASKAVCWEVSRELRDLVRLTGIDPATLLWCKSFCRWWTIGLSIILTLPLAMYARTMGANSADQWFAGGCWLLLVTILTAGFSMFASVTSNRATNAETTAVTGSFLLMVVYHLFFWMISLMIGVAGWYLSNTDGPPAGSIWNQAIVFALSFAPIAGVYRGLKSPGTFTPLDPTFLLHFVTGAFCLWAATVVMRNRLRVTTQGDEPMAAAVTAPRIVITPGLLRPRCTDRPFFWKDTYILGAGRWSQIWWTFLSGIGLIALISVAMQNVDSAGILPTVIGIIAVCISPCVIAVRFDALLTAEFRENTWNSLMLLPIDPRILILAKIQAAAWERKAMFVPVVIGAAIASYWNVIAVMIAATIALLMGILMIEVSILNQFYSKSWWVSPVTGLFIILMIVFILAFWITFGVATGFVFTCLTLAVVNFCIYVHIDWRLDNWTET